VGNEAFRRGVIIERCGAKGNVLKFLRPLIIDDQVLQEGVAIIGQSMQAVFCEK
jgi:4-aminobutyrate aminotransferase-like enzyme